MKRTEVALYINGKPVRGIIDQFEATDQAFVTSGDADGVTNTLNFTNSTGGTFTVTNSALLFNDGNEGYWSSTAYNNIIASGDSNTHTMIPGTLGMTGNTFLGGDVKLIADGQKIILGTGADTEIQQTGSETIIKDASTGNIKLRAGTITIQNGGGTKTMGVFNGANKVELFYNNNSKFETTNTGVNVTGNMVSTGNVQGGFLTNIGSPLTALDVHHDPTSLANDTGGGEVVTFGTASGALTIGKLYYLNTSGVWTGTQANASSSHGNSQLLGIALGTAVSDGILIRGFFDMNSYLTGTFNEGIPLYVCETTAGNINVAAPAATNQFIRVVGYATSTANVIYFNPDGTYITLS
tara:strand:- start:6743 stop:7801 length:1059 start_codon:yes stop_codon:yes gene_type:complete